MSSQRGWQIFVERAAAEEPVAQPPAFIALAP